ncbi:MAG: hypothetical protein HPY83_09675 [Anaerolineae bacterium]|nr:hypothetical protein [Anaerolineae bacterium]
MRRLYDLVLPVLLVATLATLVGGCATPAPTATSAPTQPPIPTDTATPEAAATPVSPLPTPGPTEPVAGMATFTDPEAGYSIDYPEGWYIYPTYGGVTIITTLDPGAPGRGGVPSDQTKIDVVPNPAGRPETLEEMVQRIRTETQVLAEEEIELAAGIPAVRVEFTGNIGGRMAAVLAVIEGTSIQVQAYGDLEPLDAIASTLRPADEDAMLPPPSSAGCINTAPFSEGCRQYQPPEALTEEAGLLGVLPTAGIGTLAWSPDGRKLAYAVSSQEAGFPRLEVRRLPDFAVTDRWHVEGIGDVAWTPDGEGLVFTFPKEDFAIGIALARLGEADWADLMPGTGRLSVSDAKQFVAWLGDTTVAFTLHCGTACESLYSLDVETGELAPLVNLPGGEAPYAEVFATVYHFSPDQEWLAATSWGRGLGEAVVLPWPGPEDPLALADLAGAEWTQALGWAADEVLFVAYSGDPSEWEGLPKPLFHAWQPGAEVTSIVAEGGYSAAASPEGNRLAVVFLGEPVALGQGRLTSEGNVPYAAILAWPELGLLGWAPLGEVPVTNTNDLFGQVPPVWSPDGRWAVFFSPEGGALALDAEGQARELLRPGVAVMQAAWGDEGHLALLVEGQVWLLRFD